MRVLFCGLGGVGQRHLRVLKQLLPDIEIGAIRSRGRIFEICDTMLPDTRVDIEAKYNIRTFPDLERAQYFHPDFAVVANPTCMHVTTALELVKKKIPVLLEKPVSDTHAGVEDLIRISKENSTPVMIGYMMRFNPCAMVMKEYIDRKVLGRIYSISIIVNSYMPGWHKYEKYNEFYAGKRALGGGVVLTEIHEIDLLHWLFGPPLNISAVGGKLSGLNIDVEDTVSVLMEQKDTNNNFPVTVTMSFVQKTPLRQFLVLGESGRLDWDILSNTLKIDNYDDDHHETHEFPDFQRNDMFRDQMKHFIDCIKTGSEPLTSLEKVLGGHVTALSIKDALSSKKMIPTGTL